MRDVTNELISMPHRLGRLPTSADDLVVLLMDAVYDHDAVRDADETLVQQLRAILESPLAVEIYDREMERRQPRDANTWH